MLFEPKRHQPLTETPWHSNIVQQEILAIIDDIENLY